MLTGQILLSEEKEDERSFTKLANTHTYTHTVDKPSGRVSLASLHKDREEDGEQIERETEVRRERQLCVCRCVCVCLCVFVCACMFVCAKVVKRQLYMANICEIN